jgi:TPR repeat protein
MSEAAASIFISHSSEAMRRYRMAAGQGFAMAQINLGTLYQHGSGVRQD